MMIPKSTSSEITEEMIGIDINELWQVNAENAARKWYARWNRKEPDLITRTETKNYLKGIPNSWCTILRQQCRLCPLCRKNTTNALHMESVHGIEILSYKEIWKSIKEYYDSETNKQKKKNGILKIKRGVFLENWKTKLDQVKQIIEEKLQKLYNGNSKTRLGK